MGLTFEKITEELENWIGQQALFFVATAPLSADGLLNCSPKGLDSFRVLDPLTVAYLDLTGSGIETVAHLKENGRIVFMFCAFTGPPKIVRLYGTGVFHDLNSDRFKELQPRFSKQVGARGIVEVELSRISDSCGWGVPKYEFVADREALTNSSIKRGEQGLVEYRKLKNSKSLDGLPGF